MSLTEDEIWYIIGVSAALDQREADERDRQERMAEQRAKFKK